jgi:arylsulfatase A-like enzyme
VTPPRVLGAFAVGVSVLSGCGGAARPANLVVITLDTMRADRLPSYGFSGVATPAIDRLAADGVVFEQAFAAVPLTLPSHTSLMTGLLPVRHAVRDNASPPLRADVDTLAEILRGRGFSTAAFVASAVLSGDRGLAPGFETYQDPPRGCDGMARMRRPAAEVVDEAIGWLSDRPAAPFFLWVHLFDAHQPFELPADYTRLYAEPYLGAIAYQDAHIARLLAQLDRTGHLEKTLIVLAGDHGESQGDHGEDAHGLFVYQKVLHVPLIVRGPAIRPHRVAAVTRVIDVFPTVLDLFGIEPQPSDGLSLVPLIEGAADDGREVYAESMYPRRFGWAGLASLRADRYKLISAPRPELYDLDADPAERRNLFGDRPVVAEAMSRRLRELVSAEEISVETENAVDAALAERLASLGYVASGAARTAADPSTEVDPKDRVDAFNRMTARQRQQAEEQRARYRGCDPFEGRENHGGQVRLHGSPRPRG